MPEPYDYDSQDPTFLTDLRDSRKAVEVVASWLSSQGYPVVVRPTFERPDPSAMAEFADDGDLEILQRVEVKRRRSLTFTSREDFPHPTLIVDACHCYDRARPKPYAYIILNREMTTAFVVDCRTTRPHWAKVTKHDRFKNRERHFYECPIHLVRVERLS
jgi:hypothetical protein